MCDEIMPENLVMPICGEVQKGNRVDVRKELVELADENILKNVVTGDVTWFCGYDVATTTQSALGHKNFTQIPKARQDRPLRKWC
jgi:hypothetical protein